MKLTLSCFYRHPKYYYFCNNKFRWGLRKHRESCHKAWRKSIYMNQKLKVVDYMSENKFKLPPGYILEDAKDVFSEDKLKINFILNKGKPWPYNEPEILGTRASLDFKEERILSYNKKISLLEGFKGAMNFSNTILESENSLPQLIQENENKVVVNKKILDMLNKRLDWSLNNDSYNYPLPKTKIFPKLNKVPVQQYGINLNRKEYNSLNSYYECSDILVSQNVGAFHRPKIISPKYSVAFQRENKKILMDLRCDFITLNTSNLLNDIINLNTPISENVFLTKNKDLINIEPVNWQFNFEKTHFYPDNLNEFHNVHDVHTIFLSTCIADSKPMPDRHLKGHALMFLYGYSVAKARQLYGNLKNYDENLNYKILERPIVTHSVFINYLKKNIGFASFQLNTTDFNSDIKNQVWFDGMYDFMNDKELILKKISSLNLYNHPKTIN